jgi:hypothetical protein
MAQLITRLGLVSICGSIPLNYLNKPILPTESHAIRYRLSELGKLGGAEVI